MNEKTITSGKKLSGLFSVPGDKSISHRAIILGAIAEGTTEIEGFLPGKDCLSTIDCFRKLGVDICINGDKVQIYGRGFQGLNPPKNSLNCGNSGTTLRLMAGLLASQPFSCELTGDASLKKRPMNRVFEPLRQMGAQISGRDGGTYAPITIEGRSLQSIEYTLPVASAQVKSAILLAGLCSGQPTVIHEPIPCRNHTEIMLNHLGAEVQIKNKTILSPPVPQLKGRKISIPGDISSAAFLIAACLITPNSHIIITNVGVNITRTGIIFALKEMGAQISVLNRRMLCGEPVADIEVHSSKLWSTSISGKLIPRIIDEIPIFIVAALFAEGITVIKDAEELRVKESDRIQAMTQELKKMGASLTPTNDGVIIEGGQRLKGAAVNSFGDHRIAMSLAIAALAAQGDTCIQNSDCTDVSFPGFFEILDSLGV